MPLGYVTDILILLSVAVLIVPVFQYFGFGAIPGFLVAGAVIGPSGLGYIQDHHEVAHLAEFGIIFLLFVIGIEIRPSNLWRIKRLVLGLGTLQVLLTGGGITAITRFLFELSWDTSLLIGLALSLSSTAFVLQLLSDRKGLSSEYGRTSVAVLLLQDLAVVPLLILVTVMAKPEFTIVEDIPLALLEAVLILGFIVFLTRYILTPLLGLLSRFGSPELFTASALLLVLGSAYAMEQIGLSMAMGAFVAGLLIADSPYRHQIIAEVQPFRGLLLGLFFMSMGMSLNPSHFFESPFLLIGVTVTLMALKCLILWPLSRAFGLSSFSSLAVAVLLAQSGEFALVLFSLATGLNILDAGLFQQLLMIVLLSMLITPALDTLAAQLASRKHSTSIQLTQLTTQEASAPPIIIVGFGRMGHRIGYIMEQAGVPYLAVDNNEALVTRERKKNKPVYFGDVRNTHVLRAAGAMEAPLVIVAINDPGVTEQIVSSFYSVAPDIPIFARGHDLTQCYQLRSLGAYETVSETLEASAELAHAALRHKGVDAVDITYALRQFRNNYYQPIREEHKGTPPKE